MAIPTTTREYRLPKYDGYHNLTIKEATLPPPKANEVLVKIIAVSLQYRDLMVSKGQYPLGHKDNVVPGSDMAGEIIAVGADVAGFKKGDRVCANFALDHVYGDVNEQIKNTGLGAPIDGVLTEYRNFPAHSLVHIPAHLSYVEASTLPCAALTAYNALNGPTPLKAGDTVLVQGTGGVSIFALQLAKASGATVIATSSSDAKLKVAKELGADHLINYKQTPDWEKEVLRITEGRGVDHVVEVGGPGTLMKSLASVRYAGWVHVIGFVAGAGDTSNAPVVALSKAAMIRGILIGSRDQFEAMNRLIVANKLKPIVDKVFSFEEAQEAYAYLESQKHVGKVVIKVAKD
ncbi:NAD P-binding protein [Gloeophyllum trabeum ATCC 11539]|uniref:NAD P-binding protein n=1 Tax=Gloeophyllum trabeum (strain ATCC 11539 / FP-39264 / Madison 617) TaxID=670483 RepID=S7Q956_GLOTA|nr:NAD P-binding protein [Gloeophyllum trabeum ATCC 11539]EPQ55973.1 NAD P-binding protein [Gloeophyllum trabeum ATCC 11539]